MSAALHVSDLLESPPREVAPVCVLVGDEPFLQRLALRCLRQWLLDDDALLTSFDGGEVTWRDVSDELHTASLFGAAGRVVLVSPADDFVSKARAQLEDYVAAPHGGSTLLLSVKSWPGNTRLAKAVACGGLVVTCRPPERAAGKKAIVDVPKLVAWISGWAASAHGIKMQAGATEQLLEIVGDELGIIDQELAKLALSVDDPLHVSVEDVVQIAGGWRTRTAWDLLDAACDGNAGLALTLLDRMLVSSEHPVKLFGAVSWSLRRFAAATRRIQEAERDGRRLSVAQALEQAGVRRFPPDALARAQRQLTQIGRVRAAEIYRWLLELDLQMKGSHSHPDRARQALELLLLKLSKPAKHLCEV